MAAPVDQQEVGISQPATLETLYANALDSKDEHQLGVLLLHCASYGINSFVRRLLDEGNAPIDFADETTGLTALHMAVGQDELEVAQFLVERGAAFVPDRQGRLPSVVAAECEVSDEMCDFIAEAEAKAEGV
jgi:uncharacterized protein